MSKPKLLILCGAGASMDVGMPSTSDLNQVVAALPNPVVKIQHTFGDAVPYVNNIEPYVKLVWEHLKTRYAKPNFEHLLFALELLAKLDSPLDSATPSHVEDHVKPMHSAIGSIHAKLGSWHNKATASAAHIECIRAIVNDIYRRSLGLEKSDKWVQYKVFWETVTSRFDVSVITLNYGDEIEKASGLPNDIGFNYWNETSRRRLYPLEFHRRMFEPQVIHLHGYIQFIFGPASGPQDKPEYNPEFVDEFNDIYFEDTVPGALANLNGARISPPESPFGMTYVGPVIAGLNKTAVLEYSPYRYYHIAVELLLKEIDNLMVIGYGFGDEHVNQMIGRIRNYDTENRKKKVYVITSPKTYEDERVLLETHFNHTQTHILAKLGRCSWFQYKLHDGELTDPLDQCRINVNGFKDAMVASRLESISKYFT